MGFLEKPTVREDGLQLNEYRRFQERFWNAERIAWVVFTSVITAALFGVSGGGGPLASKTTQTDSAVIEHPRFARWEGTDEMRVRFKPDAVSSQRSLFLGDSFAEHFQVEDIQPLPVRTTIEGSGQRLFFDNSSRDGGNVRLHLRAQVTGRATLEIEIDGEPVSLTSFIFP